MFHVHVCKAFAFDPHAEHSSALSEVTTPTPHTHMVLTPIHLGESPHTSWRPDVEMSRYGGSADIVPVLVIRSQLVELGQLDDVHSS